jgi:hypothetical protein
VHRLAYNGDFAAGQMAVFQGGPSRTGGKAPISEPYRPSEQRGKSANRPRPEGCDENGPAAALPVGYIPPSFFAER